MKKLAKIIIVFLLALSMSNCATILGGPISHADKEWEIKNSPETKFRIGSITKQFTAMLILQLVLSTDQIKQLAYIFS